MRDARYFRSQAAMCLRFAGQLNHRSEAEALRALAAEYLERAAALEAGKSGSEASSTGRDLFP